MQRNWRCRCTVAMLTAGILAVAGRLPAAAPTVEQALKLSPVQKGVQFDVPAADEVARCSIKADKIGGKTGWVVRDPVGQMLRVFMDTNDDNVVDMWSYYQDGVEVYRDIDSNHNGKADQYRWLNTGGSRWGVDANEDAQIDSWKSISAEEVTGEIVAALAAKDIARFQRVLLTADEAAALGLGEVKAKELADKLKAAPDDFKRLVAAQTAIGPKCQWLHFGGTRPGVFPAGSDGATKDVLAYENVLAMFDNEGKQGQLQIGTVVKAGDLWRVIAAPAAVDEGQAELKDVVGFFFRSPAATPPDLAADPNAPSEELQKLLADLETLDQAAASASTAQAQNEYNSRRAELIEKLAAAAKDPTERAQWLRQLADTVSAAVQSGTYPDGVPRLQSLLEKLTQEPDSKDLAGYVKFRLMTAEYGLALSAEKLDFVKVQQQWLEGLEQYIKDYPTSPDAADAMVQLAMAHEFAGQEDEAARCYAQIVEKFPDSAPAKKAAGARKRLESVGKTLALAGTTNTGGKVSVKDFGGKVLLVHYWSTEFEPCVAELATLRDLQAKYGRAGFALLGINLDVNKKTLDAFLKKNKVVSWPQMWEPGGLESRPAVELGILTLPTALLVDGEGQVVNRNIHVSEIESELKKLLK
jgi:tetratricopeptide (TPR) repeat protein